MKLKQRIGDFRVRELLVDGYLADRGEYRIYRITKRKMTTPEAVRVLATEAGVDVGDIEVAGLKDRQAITIQHMSVPRGREVRLQEKELKIDTAGFASEPLRSEFSRGNSFELSVRALTKGDIDLLRRNVPIAREQGLVNYFDDQRFGNLTHGQGWIARDLMQGEYEEGLKALLGAFSPHDDGRRRSFKEGLRRSWGDWRACRDVAGRYGQHHSIFEHLAKTENDFAGAFYHVASRLRLIHLYAFQSHLWNRAVVEHVRSLVAVDDRLALPSEEGPLVTYSEAPPPDLVKRRTFRLPGEKLDDVKDPVELDLLEDALAHEKLVPDSFRIEGVSGFQLKGEDRPLLVRPAHLRVRPAEMDTLNRGRSLVRIRFELPRGAYATLVVKRLFARRVAEERERARRRDTRTEGDRREDRGPRRGGWNNDRRGGRAGGRRPGGGQPGRRGGGHPGHGQRGSGRAPGHRE